jgi:acyl-CoA reductase-like NAD-dependent aldehyde dehydrogenase
LESAARKIAEAAFGFAGQRCTANRRVIVEDKCYDVFLQHLKAATRAMNWGDPCDEKHSRAVDFAAIANSNRVLESNALKRSRHAF